MSLVSPSRLVMLIFIFYLIVGISAAPERQVYSQDEGLKLFEQFIEEHNKQYDHEEKEERFKIFLDNLKEINDHNERSSHATFGITQFSDLTNEEFVKRYTGYKSESNSSLKKFKTTAVPESLNYTVPDEFDWRSKGVVSRVKNQHQCGSCWAFSTTGNVESMNAIKSGNIVEISEQQLVDCDHASSGCNGGNQVSALDYLVQNGAMSSQSYPYQAQDGTCSYNSQSVVIKLRQSEYLRLDEEDMKENLYSTGPASIGLAAIPLKHYNGGILVDECSDPQVNHAVLLVGYGQENGVPFWLIKNSWGTSWGEDGYFRIKRGVDCLHLTREGIARAIL